jgi:creatinine amidohydrolase
VRYRKRVRMLVVRARVLAAGLCLVLICVGRVFAEAPDTVLLEELTWTEVRDLVGAKTTTIIVPVGATEQNGPHMALGKHNARVKILSEKIARTLGNTLVAPVIAYVPEGQLNPATGHMRFPGTITVPSETFQKVLEYAARSFKLHGFRDIAFLADHGGTQADVKAVAARLNREWAAGPARAHAIEEYYRAAVVEFPRLLGERGYRKDEVGIHAGLADTSLLLAIDPRLARAGRLRPDSWPPGASGVSGDPTRASAELGRLGVEMIVARTVEAIRKSIAHR